MDVGNPSLGWVLVLALERLGHTFMIGSAKADGGVLSIVSPDVVIADKAAASPAPAIWFEATPAWLDETLRAPRAPFVRSAAAADDVIAIILSSGTTGRRKRIPITRAMMDARGGGIAHMPNARPLRSMILYGSDTVGGLNIPLRIWFAGDTVLLFPGFGSDFIAAGQPDSLSMSPTQLQQTLAQWPDAFRSGRPIIIDVGGSVIPPSLTKTLLDCPSAVLIGSYGSTEAPRIASADLQTLRAHPGVAGYVNPASEVRIVSSSGQPLPPGEVGEIWVKTTGMANQYLGDAQASARAFRDGWFRPGDMGLLTPDGLLMLEGRIDDLLNIGGVKLTARDVEHGALEIAGVADAGAAAFQTTGGRWLLYCAIVSGGACDCGQVSQELSQLYRVPVRVVEVAQIPRNAMGKIQRELLKMAIIASQEKG